jgi:putative ABC transport system permease protein
MAVTFVSLRLTSRNARTASVVEQRRQLDVTWRPAWRRLRLDHWAIVVALIVLGVNALTGGSRRTTVEGVALAAGFYLLIAPIALWLGVTLVGVRSLAALLARRTRPERSRPLTTWPASGFRWLGRRPGRTASAVIIGSLAVAFGTNLLAFIGTYNSAKRTEAAISVGADVRVTPGRILPAPSPPVGGPDVASSVPVHAVVMTVGTDRRTALAVDPAAYAKTVTKAMPDMSGGSRDAALRGLATDTTSVLVSRQFAKEFSVAVGDSIDATVLDPARKPVPVKLHVTGVFWAVAPTVPGADFLMNTAAVPPTALQAPDFYLIKAAQGHTVDQIASRFRAAVHGRQTWTVDTFRNGIGKNQSTLAKLNLGGLGRIETAGTLVIASLGLAVLGAFLVLERRREYAVMRSLGATTAQVLVPPGVEGLATVVASVLVGVPVGLLMAVLSVRVLSPLFTLRPPLLHADPLALGGLVAAVVVTTSLAFAGSLITVARLRTVSVLRET